MSDRLSKILNHEIANVNKHLPVRSIPLNMALKMDIPQVRLRNREFMSFDKKELEFIADFFTPNEQREVELPIFLTRRRDLGSGAFFIGGNPANVYVIQKILNPDLPRYMIWKLTAKIDTMRIIYRPQYQEIRKKLKTTTIPAFA